MIIYLVVCQYVGSLRFYTKIFTSYFDVEEFAKNHHVIDVQQLNFHLEVSSDGLR